MVRFGIAAFACVLALAGVAQEMDMAPPKELKAVEFLLGSWSGTNKMSFGDQTMDSPGTVKSDLFLGGRFVRSLHVYEIAGMKFEGCHMLSYDTEKKKYVAWWFDQVSAQPMEMDGNFEGENKLVMVSKPTPMPGMGNVVFRSTWVKVSAQEVRFTLEQKDGDKWSPMIQSVYKKT
jgi:hypothetical protein